MRLCRRLRELTPPRALRASLGRFPRTSEGRKKKQDKGQASRPPLCPLTPSRSAGRGNGLRELQRGGGDGVKIRGNLSFCGRYPPTLTPTTKKQGSSPGKKPNMGKKEKFALYLTPEKKALLERRYQEDGSRSLTAFIENAIDFYLDYLSANNAGLFLSKSVQSYLDGRQVGSV